VGNGAGADADAETLRPGFATDATASELSHLKVTAASPTTVSCGIYIAKPEPPQLSMSEPPPPSAARPGRRKAAEACERCREKRIKVSSENLSFAAASGELLH
jgi:hypothetical protein